MFRIRAFPVGIPSGFLLLFLATSLLFGQTFQGKPIIQGIWRGEPAKYIGGEILVMFYSQDAPATDIASRIGGKIVRGVEADGFAKIEVPIDADIPALCDRLHGDPRVRFAEPNFLTTAAEWNPADPYYSNGTQWNLRNTGQNPPLGTPDADIDANWAWDYSNGNSMVILSILDSGIDMDTTTMTLRHNDLDAPGKIITGPDYIEDGHGVADFLGHGTHVAGIASAETNNNTGIAGVAGDCKLLIIQVFDAAGHGNYEALRNGIIYSVDYQLSQPGTRIIMNFSGGGDSPSDIVFAALQIAQTFGDLFITASGNDANSTCGWPCQYSSDLDNVICVGASTPWDQKASYSNYCNDVDVVAPGGYGNSFNSDDIYSCVPPNSYAFKYGTSMAAPHVTGICGLVISQNMSMTAADLKTLIRNTADDQVGTLADDPIGYDTKFGWGRVNAWSAIIHSPAFPYAYLRSDQRCSNVYTTAWQYKKYRLYPPTVGNWEVAAVRPQTGIDADIQWLSTDASTVLAASECGNQVVDFVLANQRPTSGSDYYAEVLDYSGSGKFAVEYQQATESYIGTMHKANFQWKSAHVVEIWQLYLQHHHWYNFQVTMTPCDIDVGLALFGRTGSGPYFTQRSSSVCMSDTTGAGGSEACVQYINGDDGWYALVLWSNNGRNGIMDISVKERLIPSIPITINEQNNVIPDSGYYYSQLTNGTTMGVIGLRPNPGNNYDLKLFSISSCWSANVVDFILYNKANWYGWNNLLVYPVTTISGSSGYVLDADDADETIALGTNGPFTFAANSVIKAQDISLTSGTLYQFTADITSGTADLGIGLYRHRSLYENRSQSIIISDSHGAGEDENFSWLCDSTRTFTLVTWSNNGQTGTYLLKVTNLPNLITTIPSGWDFEVVPRNSNGGSHSSCHLTATLPGNSYDTYYNFAVRSGNPNPVTGGTFYNQIYLDNTLLLQVPIYWGISGNTTIYYNDLTSGTVVRGGRHTLELRLDGTNTIVETDENDNNVSHQFIWSPLVLTNGVAMTRSTPPPPGSFLLSNCDGFQYTRTGNYAYGVAICPTVSNEDFDEVLYTDYVGSDSGFSWGVAGSNYGRGQTDFSVATYTGVASTVYPGIDDQYGTGTHDYIIEAIDANGKQLAPTDLVLSDTLLPNEILNVYEAYMQRDTNYTISTTAISGTADIALALYGPTYDYYGRSDYLAYCNTTGSNETILYTPTTTAWYVVVVFKPSYSQLSLQLTYNLSVLFTPPNPNLVTTVPPGWSYEFVPRNTGGATSGNCHITASLPGNTANTYLNFCAMNSGNRPVPATTFYDQLYLDGVYFFQREWNSSIPPGNTIYQLNSTTTTPIRGGRHTMELRLDGTNTITETSDADNSVWRQFVWSPAPLQANGAAVTRNAPPIYGTLPQPNCDGFDFATGTSIWSAVGIIPMNAGDNYNLRLHPQWTNSLQGFDSTVAISQWSAGQSDFVIVYRPSADILDIGVINDSTNPGTGNFIIHEANKLSVWSSPGTHGPYSLDSTNILKVWEVHLNESGYYRFQVNVTSGTADIGTSLYDYNLSNAGKSDYYAGGYSNSTGAGGNESFTVYNETTGESYAWVVWKVGANDRLASVTFNLTFGLGSPPIPRSVADLVIFRVDSTSAGLSWSPVTQDTTGLPVTISYYRIHRNTNPDFIPSPSDSIGYSPGNSTAYLDPYAIWSQSKYFYRVIAVASGITADNHSIGEGGTRAVGGNQYNNDNPIVSPSRLHQ